MKQRVSEYIADFLAENGCRTCFSVTGGGAMYLNDSLGNHPRIRTIYNHHEQACAMAAEAYARVHGQIAAVCVTTGPGGTNAMTGVLGGWLDSIPMLILSGQVRYDTTARGMGVPVRAGGDQEFEIVSAVSTMTKYAQMVTDPAQIRFALEKALYLATHGRPGPCWIDIPVDIQGAYIETESLCAFSPQTVAENLPQPVKETDISQVLAKIEEAKRPVFYVGSGVRTAGAADVFLRVAEKLGVPVVTGWNSIDLIPTLHSLYVGRGGMMGDRAGNFAVQNADLILAVGNRLSIRQVGYRWRTWARAAYVIMVDADAAELQKPTLHVEMPLHADAFDFLSRLEAHLSDSGRPFADCGAWRALCTAWREKYPPVTQKQKTQKGKANVYALIDALSAYLPEQSVTVVGNGSACVVGSQAFVVKKGTRFLINSGAASMGYDLPAAIGACLAAEQMVVCVTGEGSIQMNLQELQTICTNRLPIKIFVIQNGGYHSIRQTQRNLFGEARMVGIGAETGDLSFPDLAKIAWAYGIPYLACHENEMFLKTFQTVFSCDGAYIAEIFVDTKQTFEPKSATLRLPDGRLVSPPLEDLAPFLPREELREQMQIPLVEDHV